MDFSLVAEIDPLTFTFPYIYKDESSGLMRGTFFNYADGGAQRLSNGNTFIAEAKFGRIFEVTDSGQIVWEYIIPFRDALNSNATYRAYKVQLDWAGPHFVPDLVVSGDDDPDPVQAGGNLNYAIELENTGSDPAVNVELFATTPIGTTFQSIAAPAGWDCSTPAVGGTGSITCTNVSQSAGSMVAFTIEVGVDLSVGDGTIITITATASSAGSDATPGDNSTTIDTTAANP